jgi:acyl carrier protein
MSTYEKLLDIIAEHRDIDKATITPDTAFTDMGLDSLDMVELIMAIEETFGKTVELDADVKTVGQAAKLVDEA